MSKTPSQRARWLPGGKLEKSRGFGDIRPHTLSKGTRNTAMATGNQKTQCSFSHNEGLVVLAPYLQVQAANHKSFSYRSRKNRPNGGSRSLLSASRLLFCKASTFAIPSRKGLECASNPEATLHSTLLQCYSHGAHLLGSRIPGTAMETNEDWGGALAA